MDPFRESLAKALTGEPGDKRNTKYALAGAGGLALGVNVGNQLGARSAGTTPRQNRREVLAALKAHSDSVKAELAAHPLPKESRKARRIRIKHNKDVKRGKGGVIIPEPKIPTATNYTPTLRVANKIANSVKGTKAIHRGGEAGALLGAATGLAAYGAYRKRKREVAKYWEGTPKPERRKPAFTDAALGAATGMAVGGAAAYALTRGKAGKTVKITRTITRTLKPKVSRPKAPAKQKSPEPKPKSPRTVLKPKNEVPDAIPNRDPDVQLTPRSVQETQRENARKREAALKIYRWKQAQADAARRAQPPKGQIPQTAKTPRASSVSPSDEEFNIVNPAAQARARRRANAQMHGKPGKRPRNAFGVNE